MTIEAQAVCNVYCVRKVSSMMPHFILNHHRPLTIEKCPLKQVGQLFLWESLKAKQV